MDTATTLDKGHGRRERRTLRATTALNEFLDWPGVAQVGEVTSRVDEKGKHTEATRYFITSVPREVAGAGELLGWTRGHWSIEIPQPENPRSDNLSALGRAGYHRRRRPVGVGRVERQKPSGPRRHLMLDSESTCVPPRSRFPRRAH
jgi:hypothetical protein